MKRLYIDVETTGLNPKLNDVVQIAGFIEIDGKVRDQFDIKLQPINPDNISEEALQVTGMTKANLMAYPPADKGLMELINLFDRYINKFNKNDKLYPIGHNVRFDMDFLRAMYKKIKFKYFGSYVSHICGDTMQLTNMLIVSGVIPQISIKLADACEYFKVELINAHDAMSDIKATKELWETITQRYVGELYDQS